MNKLKFVFCEGGDDQGVIAGVAASINITDIRVEPFLGKDNLRNFLRVLRTRPEFAQNKVATIAIIRDADEDETAAFQSVCDALKANNFKAPEKNGGFVANGIRVGVLVVGPNDGKGMVEDLCLKSVSHLPEFPCVNNYFQCIAERSERKVFSSKAKVRVWMASHVDHELYVGKAAEKGYWPWQSAAFDSIKEFLRQV
jgi:hypothetical protein